MKLKYVFVVCVATFFSSASLQAQRVVADRIIAQVGDKIILHSDIVNAIADYKRQGAEAQLPPNPECAFLEGQLIQKALVLQAQKDSLTVSEDELDALLDNQIRGFIQMYGSKEVLEDVAGKSVYQLKEDFREPFRERKLAEQMRGKILDNVRVTPTEVKNYFSKIPKDSLPFYESELEVSQVVVYPKANKDVDEYVVKELYDMKRQVESGQKKFEQLAKLYTEDPSSKESGGQYNINRNEKSWDPTFLSAAFKLKEGQVSPVIKSKFGYHIIQMVSRAGDDAVVRHILRIPTVTEIEIGEGKAKLDSIRSKIIAGNISFNEAVNKYSDDENSKFNGGAITGRDGSSYITIDQLDKDLVGVLNNQHLKTGEISQPAEYTDERGRKAVRLITLKSRSEPHRENLKDDYNKIA
ncbi:MAG: peptidylprolyl isomerase, partial [Chitinophagaceae bacterium]|nr:peptidylprolyl isomerase [Chitinophagaceae bacterium]